MNLLDRRDSTRPYLIAHRGNSALCPENTVRAFRQAVVDGADIIETDVRVTADGHFVLIHDPTLERTTEGKGKVDAYTLEQLKTAAVKNGSAGGEQLQIPTLEEMIAVVPPPVVLALELKSREFRGTDVCMSLARALTSSGVADRTLILSSHGRHLRAWRRAAPDIPTGLVSWMVPWPPRGVQLLGPLWPILALNPFYVKIAHRRGQLVCPLDPRPDRRLSWYLRAGCDALLSDDPGQTRTALGREAKPLSPVGSHR